MSYIILDIRSGIPNQQHRRGEGLYTTDKYNSVPYMPKGGGKNIKNIQNCNFTFGKEKVPLFS